MRVAVAPTGLLLACLVSSATCSPHSMTWRSVSVMQAAEYDLRPAKVTARTGYVMG